MSFQDKLLQYSDCGREFIFTTGEQEFYSSRSLQNASSVVRMPKYLLSLEKVDQYIVVNATTRLDWADKLD